MIQQQVRLLVFIIMILIQSVACEWHLLLVQATRLEVYTQEHHSVCEPI